jgi:hypothetical protein
VKSKTIIFVEDGTGIEPAWCDGTRTKPNAHKGPVSGRMFIVAIVKFLLIFNKRPCIFHLYSADNLCNHFCLGVYLCDVGVRKNFSKKKRKNKLKAKFDLSPQRITWIK